MKIRNFILAAAAVLSMSVSCREIESDLSFPSISMVQSEELTFDQGAGSRTVSFITNRAWKATADVDWVAIDPSEGEGSTDSQTVTVTVLDNSSWDRTATVTIDIVYDTQTFPLAQAGKGSPDDRFFYFNDFDKEIAEQSYGSSKNSWPYLDQFDGWKNEKGKGVDAIEYEFASISARNNSNSNGTYSDYDGSGANNLLFSTNGYIKISKIALNGNTDVALSFGTEKYDNNNKNALFTASELPVYISADGQKWVLLDYSYAGTAAGRWNLASATFSVPSGTEYLYLYITSTLSGVHRIDDLSLEISEQPGTAIDFSKGIELGSGTVPDPGTGSVTDAIEVTCAKAAELCKALQDGANSQETYTVTGYITDVFATVSKGQQSFWMADTPDGGKIIQAYWANLPEGVASFTKGAKVKITGKLLKYVNGGNVTAEIKNATVVILEEGGAGTGGSTEPGTGADAIDVTCAKAAELCNALADGAESGQTYSVTGYITDVFANVSRGQQSFWMADTPDGGKIIQAYWANLPEGVASFTKGAKVKITGKLLKYVKDGAVTPEIKNADVAILTDDGGDPGSTDPGEGESGNKKTIATGTQSLTWSDVTDEVYGEGKTVTSDGVAMSVFKYKSTTNLTNVLQTGHIRVYKDYWVSVSVEGASKITKVQFSTTDASYTYDMTVSDGSMAKADTGAKTVTWTGSLASFGAQSSAGQIRITGVTVTYE
ncbi:MAG: BACON domain-containing protein [Bacteroidales bacterium]|nr:BACON domain-containing protein [Bacteroidales bacterium]